MTNLSAKILALATAASAVGVRVNIQFFGDDAVIRALADMPESEVAGIINVRTGMDPWLAISVDLRFGQFGRVWLNASHQRIATSREMEAASRWEEQTDRRVGFLRRLP